MDFLRTLTAWFKPQEGVRAYDPGSFNAGWTVLGADESERNLLTNNKEWVFIAINKIATSVASVRFKVMKYQKNGDDKELFDGDMVAFLERPSSQFTGKDFIYLNTVYKELTGNAFWEITKKKTLLPLIPTLIRPKIEGGKLIGYEYQEGATPRAIAIEDVLHDRYVDPAKPYWGVGKLQKIMRWVDTSSFANEFLRRFFINGATFGGFIETEEESEERIKLIKIGLANDHVGVANSHKMAVLPKGSKFSPSTAKMSDMQFTEMDNQYRDKILAGFGVPKTLVGLTTEVNRASAEASEYIYAKYTVKPVVDDLIEFLNVNVAPLFDPTGSLYFAYEEFVPCNEELNINERKAALNMQAYKTVNEVRAELGLPKVQGGDVIYASPMQTPLGTELPEAAAPGADPKDPQDPKDEPKKAMPHRMRQVAAKERAIDNLAGKVFEIISANHESPDETAHKSFVSRVDAHMNLIADRVRGFNDRQRRDVGQKLNRITKSVSKTDIFDMDEEVGALVDFVEPMLKGLMVEQAIAEYEAQGFSGTLDQSRTAIRTTVELAAKRLARSYNDTTANLLKGALNAGIEAGDDLMRLTNRVLEVYAYSDRVRARAVAHTEAFYIANEGSREAYKQSGVVKSMRWYTSEDERVCPYCAPQDGRIVGVSESFFKKGETVEGNDGTSFVSDYRAMTVPPLHTNCRCFIRPETIEV